MHQLTLQGENVVQNTKPEEFVSNIGTNLLCDFSQFT